MEADLNGRIGSAGRCSTIGPRLLLLGLGRDMAKRIEDPAREWSEWNTGWRFVVLCVAVLILAILTGFLTWAAAETIGDLLDAF